MRTSKVEEKIYQSLKSDEELLSKLGNGENSIFHLQVPAGEFNQYPIINYAPISDVPFFHADDKVLAHRLSIRIWIITLDGGYTEIAKNIHRIMINLGAKRYQAIPYVENVASTWSGKL